MAQPEASAVESSTAEADAPTPAPPAAPHTMNTYRNEAAHSATTAFHNDKVRTSSRAGTLPPSPESLSFAEFRKHSNFSNKVIICCSKLSSGILNVCSPIFKKKSKREVRRYLSKNARRIRKLAAAAIPPTRRDIRSRMSPLSRANH